jgi:hypothetical protein
VSLGVAVGIGGQPLISHGPAQVFLTVHVNGEFAYDGELGWHDLVEDVVVISTGREFNIDAKLTVAEAVSGLQRGDPLVSFGKSVALGDEDVIVLGPDDVDGQPDFDGDGHSNLLEVLAGTDAHEANHLPDTDLCASDGDCSSHWCSDAGFCVAEDRASCNDGTVNAWEECDPATGTTWPCERLRWHRLGAATGSVTCSADCTWEFHCGELGGDCGNDLGCGVGEFCFDSSCRSKGDLQDLGVAQHIVSLAIGGGAVYTLSQACEVGKIEDNTEWSALATLTVIANCRALAVKGDDTFYFATDEGLYESTFFDEAFKDPTKHAVGEFNVVELVGPILHAAGSALHPYQWTSEVDIANRPVTAVLQQGAKFVAVGRDRFGLIEDAATAPHETNYLPANPGPSYELQDVVQADGNLIAVGWQGDEGIVWGSTDGAEATVLARQPGILFTSIATFGGHAWLASRGGGLFTVEHVAAGAAPRGLIVPDAATADIEVLYATANCLYIGSAGALRAFCQ